MIDVASLARDCGFERIAQELAALARPSLRLVPDTDARSRVRSDFPGGMTVFAEIDLAELDPAVWHGPRHGVLRLSCFQDPDHGSVEPGVAVEAVLVDELTLEGVAVRGVPELTIPHQEAEVLSELGLDDDWPAYDALEERLVQAQGFRLVLDDRLLGWPQYEQFDALWVDHEEEEEETVDELHLLLQLQGDFGDGGTLFFTIPAGDVERGRFDRVRAESQTG